MGIFDFLKKNKNIENDNGLNEIYYDDGKGLISKRYHLKNGLKCGLYQEWFQDGSLSIEGTYKIIEGKEIIVGEYKKITLDVNTLSVSFSDENGVQQWNKEFNMEGQLLWESLFVDGERSILKGYINNVLRSENIGKEIVGADVFDDQSMYIPEYANGTIKRYNEKGNLILEIIYNDGTGVGKSFDNNGVLLSEDRYIRGEKSILVNGESKIVLKKNKLKEVDIKSLNSAGIILGSGGAAIAVGQAVEALGFGTSNYDSRFYYAESKMLVFEIFNDNGERLDIDECSTYLKSNMISKVGQGMITPDYSWAHVEILNDFAFIIKEAGMGRINNGISSDEVLTLYRFTGTINNERYSNGVIDPLGCTDPTATNYDPTATIDDGSCLYPVEGYSYLNSKGKTYYLHSKDVKNKSTGKMQTIYYFTPNIRYEGCDLPDGQVVYENPKNQIPMLKSGTVFPNKSLPKKQDENTTVKKESGVKNKKIKNQELPDWFDGKIFKKGGVVKGYLDIECELTAEELSMFNFMEKVFEPYKTNRNIEVPSEIGMKINRGLKWFREYNPDIEEKLFG